MTQNFDLRFDHRLYHYFVLFLLINYISFLSKFIFTLQYLYNNVSWCLSTSNILLLHDYNNNVFEIVCIVIMCC